MEYITPDRKSRQTRKERLALLRRRQARLTRFDRKGIRQDALQFAARVRV